MKFIYLIIIYSFFILFHISFAQTDLSFNNLLQLNTSVSGKTLQSRQDASSFINVYDQGNLQDYGNYTIEDLVQRVPGFSNTYNFGEPGLMTRGVSSNAWDNNSHLLLIDGIPFRMARSNKIFINNALPLNFVQSIELLRGPASSLYGVGAFAGVIALNSREPGIGQSESDLRFSFGDRYSTQLTQGYTAISKPNSTTIAAFSLYSRDANGENIYGFQGDRIYDNSEDSKFAYATHTLEKGSLEGLKFGLVFTESAGGVGEHWNTYNFGTNEVIWKTWMPFVEYKQSLHQDLDFRSYVSYNQSQETGSVILTSDGSNSFASYKAVVESFEAQTEVNYFPSNSSIITFGLNYYQLQALGNQAGSSSYSVDSIFKRGNELNDDSDISRTFSTFIQSQYEFDILEGLIMSSGLRLDHGEYGESSFDQLSPRVGIVQRINSNLNFKTQYSSALKAPGVKEFNTNRERDIAIARNQSMLNPSERIDYSFAQLEAETIQTGELGFTWVNQTLFLSANTYYTILANPLQSYNLPAQETINAYKNAKGENHLYGVEIDLEYTPNQWISTFSNYTLTEIQEQSDFSLQDIPQHMFKAGFSMKTPFNYQTSFSTWGEYINAFYSYNDKTMTCSSDYLQLSSTIRQGIYSDTFLEFRATNILNSRDYITRVSEPFLPRQGREFFMGIQSKF